LRRLMDMEVEPEADRHASGNCFAGAARRRTVASRPVARSLRAVSER
jgi:hypothetical protein